jgi:hypothetical protein
MPRWEIFTCTNCYNVNCGAPGGTYSCENPSNSSRDGFDRIGGQIGHSFPPSRSPPPSRNPPFQQSPFPERSFQERLRKIANQQDRLDQQLQQSPYQQSPYPPRSFQDRLRKIADLQDRLDQLQQGQGPQWPDSRGTGRPHPSGW